MLFLAISFGIQYFEWKSLILGRGKEAIGGTIFSLTARAQRSNLGYGIPSQLDPPTTSLRSFCRIGKIDVSDTKRRPPGEV